MPISDAAPVDGPTAWHGFVATFAATALVVLLTLYGFVIGLDPYGRRAGPGHLPAPLMDVNQRYMYPQLARSGRFDAAIFGTSTLRLIDPRALGAAIGGRFANLAINAGTPWEQLQLAALFLRHVPAPSTIVFGLDRPWCDPAADTPAQRLTFRSFPRWLYNEDRSDDLPELLNLKTLEIAARVALQRLGAMRERIRGDGYEVFTPPEWSYDLARVRRGLQDGAGESGPAATPSGSNEPTRLPAIDWLAAFARSLPARTRLVVLFPPLHVSGQPVPGSREAEADDTCKRAVAAALAGRVTTILDYRRPTPLTSDDAQFWDRMHYRLPVAGRLVEDIKAAVETGQEAPDGRYRLLAVPAP